MHITPCHLYFDSMLSYFTVPQHDTTLTLEYALSGFITLLNQLNNQIHALMSLGNQQILVSYLRQEQHSRPCTHRQIVPNLVISHCSRLTPFLLVLLIHHCMNMMETEFLHFAGIDCLLLLSLASPVTNTSTRQFMILSFLISSHYFMSWGGCYET